MRRPMSWGIRRNVREIPSVNFPQLEMFVEENRIDTNAVQQIFHVVGQFGQFRNFSLVF